MYRRTIMRGKTANVTVIKVRVYTSRWMRKKIIIQILHVVIQKLSSDINSEWNRNLATCMYMYMYNVVSHDTSICTFVYIMK